MLRGWQNALPDRVRAPKVYPYPSLEWKGRRHRLSALPYFLGAPMAATSAMPLRGNALDGRNRLCKGGAYHHLALAVNRLTANLIDDSVSRAAITKCIQRAPQGAIALPIFSRCHESCRMASAINRGERGESSYLSALTQRLNVGPYQRQVLAGSLNSASCRRMTASLAADPGRSRT
jgi:hypothetical protein